MSLRIFVILSVINLVFSAATTKVGTEEKKSRVHAPELSDEEHFVNSEHNPDYDHEAFLGEDEARTFDQLTPEESKERLSIIVDKIDLDKNGFVTQEELKKWIDYTQKRYITDDVQRQWSSHNPKNNEKLSWEEYKTVVYGFMDNLDENEQDNAEEDGMSYKEMVDRDHRRWKMADLDGDSSLTFAEFSNFLHPEESEHMRDVVITETMEDIDKDQDGKISLQEYIGDMYKGESDEEPGWVSSERDQFHQYRDKDKDGFMDRDEVKAWIIPTDYDHANAEAKHLIYETDANEDKQLSKEEILDKYDVFVGSQATDFGEALVRHDEF